MDRLVRGAGALTEPLVTVVTPCLNPGPALEACLASVRAQTYPALEHVVVDAASTDGTVERLRAAEGVRWVSEPDDGQAQAINKGFALAQGEILGWLCADDELLPDAVERAVSALQETGAGWVYGDCEIVDPRHPELRRPPAAISPETFVGGNPIPQPGTLVRASVLAEIGPLDESLDLAFDFDLWLRLAIAGVRSAYVPATLARFHVSPTSKTGRHGLPPFMWEEGIALAKTHLRRGAALRLGTSAALDAARGGTISRRRLAEELRRRHALVDDDQRVVLRAAALTEATFFELPRPVALRHLLAPEPWLTAETRRQVVRRVRQRTRKLLGLATASGAGRSGEAAPRRG